MAENKKVRGTVKVIVDGVTYRSTLEARCAQILKENNILFEYEPFKIEWIPKFRYKGIAYRASNYKPDFVIDDKYILEIKGFATDVYRYKKKLVLLKIIAEGKYDFTEIHSLSELRKWIRYYKALNKPYNEP